MAPYLPLLEPELGGNISDMEYAIYGFKIEPEQNNYEQPDVNYFENK